MLIRKKFKFEGAHIVRNCSSKRCKYSLHGHSYVVEVFFTADGLDNGQMIMDFGLTKGTIKDFIDSFDHAYSFWNAESIDFVDWIKTQSARWISMPVSPSAESYSLMLLFVIDKILNATEFNNGEKNPRVYSVRVHETETGYAEAFKEDLDWINYDLEDIQFSDEIMQEWQDPGMFQKLIAASKYNQKCFQNPKVELQV